MNAYFEGIIKQLNSLPVFSEHEHHLPKKAFTGMTLDRVVADTYVKKCGFVPDGKYETRERLLRAASHNSFWRWLEEGIRQLHGIEVPITADNWDQVSEKITKAYAREDFHWRALLDAGYVCQIQDSYWEIGEKPPYKELFSSAYRIDAFTYGHSPEMCYDDDPRLSAWERLGISGGGLDDYVAAIRGSITQAVAEGNCATLKCAEAYSRTIHFFPDDREKALKAWGKSKAELSEDIRLAFSSYIFNRCCEIAADLEIPFQVHTGMGDLRGSSPMNLVPTIAAHPSTRFVLLHTGVPWVNEACAISASYENALPSFTWTPLLSTELAVHALHTCLDMALNVNTITWGSDCWCAEESVGAMLAWRHVVAQVVSERLISGACSLAQADRLLEKLMFKNGAAVYDKARPKALKSVL